MKVAIIGAGNMGAAIARGIASINKSANAENHIALTITNPSEPKLRALKQEICDIAVTTDNVVAVKDADIVVLAVKPYILPNVIDQIKPHLNYERQCLVSIAGGVSLDSLDDMLRNDNGQLPQLLWVIPDTAISVNAGMSFISTRRASHDAVARVTSIFNAMGSVAVIDEKLMQAATALSSCGIAYVYKFIQAYVQAGIQMGFKPADALAYTIATIEGAAAMLRANASLPEEEILRVTTPGGMTIKGINSLEQSAFNAAVINAILSPLNK